MTAPTAQQLLERFPDLAIHPTAVITGALAQATRLCSEDVWGETHGDGVAYLAAAFINERVREVGAVIGKPTGTPGGPDRPSSFYRQTYNDLLATLPLCGFMA
jgi:hypothetical protein